MQILKRLLVAIPMISLILLAVLFTRVGLMQSRQLPPKPFQPVSLNDDAAAAHLSEALQCKTISYTDRDRIAADEFRRLHAYLERAFPTVHAHLRRAVVNLHSLLYTWPGTDAALKPILLIAHLDVVAAEENGRSWSYPPFSGAIADGFVWGRGAVDDKGSLMAILEAVETLAQSGFTPKRTIYLAFGHDEEVGGAEGAASIATLLKERGVRLEASFDEGLVITDGIVPGMKRPLAIIAVAEKGYASFELVVKQEGGHSSQPPRQTAIEILAAALTRINQHPIPARFEGLAPLMFDYAGPEMRLPFRTLFANRWLFGGLVTRELEKAPATNAALRTTITTTMFNAGEKDNILPPMARAVVNSRLLPGDSIEKVTAHIREVVADDRVEVNALPGAHEASPVSDHMAPGFRALTEGVRQVWPEIAVAPGLDIGGTDSKHYTEIAAQQYRFAPFWFTEKELAMMHGTNERVSVKRYLEAIRFYVQLIRNSQE